MIQTIKGKKRGRPRRGTTRKKTILLDQDLLDSARRALGVGTETEAVTRALERVVRYNRQAESIRRLAEIGLAREDLID